MSLLFLSSILFSWFLLFLTNFSLFIGSSRIVVFKGLIFNIVKSSFIPVFFFFIYLSLIRYFFIIILANTPLFTVPIIYYSYVLFHSLLIWVPIILFRFLNNPRSIIAHLLPYGAPVSLIFFLPLVEIFSQIIRPFTLTIRFATNISAGHIIIFIFSYFSILSSLLAPVLYIVLLVLLSMEIFIAFLQGYIFITLVTLYFSETV